MLLAKNKPPIKMKILIAVLFASLLAPAFAADAPASAASPAKSPVHRYLVERTFPPGALDGLNAATKKKVNANKDILRLRRAERSGRPQGRGAQRAARRQCYRGTRNVVTKVGAETRVASH
jgi:hypothetical protein